jgi:hypothetical protein
MKPASSSDPNDHDDGRISDDCFRTAAIRHLDDDENA